MALENLVQDTNLGSEFDLGIAEADLVTIKLGEGLDKESDGTISTVPNLPVKNVEFERSFLASADVDTQNVNANATVNITSNRLDNGWSVTGEAFEYSGSPDRVRVSAQVHQIVDSTTIRMAPRLDLLRNGVIVATSASGYIRNGTGHQQSSNSITFVDPAPGTNPSYQLDCVRESNASANTNVVIGSFGVEAIEIESCDVYFVDCVPAPNIFGPATFTFNDGDVMNLGLDCISCDGNAIAGVFQQSNPATGGFYGGALLPWPEGEIATAAYDNTCWRFGCFANGAGQWSAGNTTPLLDCFTIEVI